MTDDHLKSEADRLRERLKEAPMRVVVENMASFLRSGGTLDWDRWEALGPMTKCAFAAAARVVAEEKTIALARALIILSTPPTSTAEPTKAPMSNEEIRAAMRAAGRLALEAGKTT